jgi:hypothetical protein
MESCITLGKKTRQIFDRDSTLDWNPPILANPESERKEDQVNHNLKNVITLFCFLATLVASPLAAQVREETILTYDIIQTERKALVMEAMDLAPQQLKDLSPVYDDYLAELDALDAQQVDLVVRFLKIQRAISDEEAMAMLQEWGTQNQVLLDLRKYYTRRFLEILPARKVLRLWQIENKLDTIIDGHLVKDIPLAR